MTDHSDDAKRCNERRGDIEDLRLAESRLQALRDGKEWAVSLDDMMKRYGLAGVHRLSQEIAMPDDMGYD